MNHSFDLTSGRLRGNIVQGVGFTFKSFDENTEWHFNINITNSKFHIFI
jgi:hypothetical protein